jgi:VanZ family protein
MKLWIRLLPAFLWMGTIFYLSSQTGDELGGLLPIFQLFFPLMEGLDWGHFLAYFILALTYAWAFPGSRLTWLNKGAVVLLCLLYGVTDEFHQIFVPGRSSDWHDLRNDAIGAALAMLLLSIPLFSTWYGKLARVKYY